MATTKQRPTAHQLRALTDCVTEAYPAHYPDSATAIRGIRRTFRELDHEQEMRDLERAAKAPEPTPAEQFESQVLDAIAGLIETARSAA